MMAPDGGGRGFACDISEYGLLRIAGEGAERFVSTMFTCGMDVLQEALAVSQGLLLTAQGEVIDVADVVRTGDAEFLVLLSPENVSEALEWLDAHAQIEDDAGKVFGELFVEDETGKLAVMLLCGAAAQQAHADLVAACTGAVALLDCAFPGSEPPYGVPAVPAHLMLVPEQLASQVGDFLVDYPQVEPLDIDALRELLRGEGRLAEGLDGAEYLTPAQAGLERLLRPEGGYVGERALKA